MYTHNHKYMVKNVNVKVNENELAAFLVDA